MITAQLGFVQTWLRDDNTLAPTLIRPRWSSSGSVVPTEIHVESVVEDEETEPAAPQIYL